MKVLTWICMNWDNIVAILVVLAALVIYAYKHGTDIIKSVRLALVTQAEATLGGGTGSLKMSTAVGWVYDKLPPLLKLILPKSGIEKMLEEGLNEAKELWGSNTAAAMAAKLPPAKYTITYDGNGAESGTVPVDTNTYNPGATAMILGNTGVLTKAGYIFVGWALSGIGDIVAPGATLTIGTADIILYAIWTAAQIAA